MDTLQDKKQLEISVTSVSAYFTQLGDALRPAVTRFITVHFQISTEIVMGYILPNLCKIKMHYHHSVILY